MSIQSKINRVRWVRKLKGRIQATKGYVVKKDDMETINCMMSNITLEEMAKIVKRK